MRKKWKKFWKTSGRNRIRSLEDEVEDLLKKIKNSLLKNKKTHKPKVSKVKHVHGTKNINSIKHLDITKIICILVTN